MTSGDTRHRVGAGDLEFLDVLTSVQSPHDLKALHTPHRVLDTVAALRHPPIDPIVLAASLSSGPQVTRHHFHHTFRDPNSEALSGHSQQMPVSERIRMNERAAAASAEPKAVPGDICCAPGASAKMLDEELERRALKFSKQAPRSMRLQREKEEAEAKQAATAAAAKANATSAVTTPLIRREPAMTKAVYSIPPLEVRCYGRTRVPTPHGEIFCHLYRNNHDNKEHMALVIDPAQNHASLQEKQAQGILHKPRHLRSHTLDAVWHKDETVMERLVRGAYVNRLSDTYQQPSQPVPPRCTDAYDQDTPSPLVRIHSECYTGETIGSQRCDCGEQLDEALRIISTSMSRTKAGKPVPPRGVVVYMRQEGRGIGLLDKLLAYNLQDMGHDTVSANVLLGHLPDARRYDISSAILRDLGIDQCRLLTNNPEKMQALEAEGIRVTERVPMVPRIWQFSHHHHHHHHHGSGPAHKGTASKARQRRREKSAAHPTASEHLSQSETQSRPSSVLSQTLEHGGAACDDTECDDDECDGGAESDGSMGSFHLHSQRTTGATLIGGSVTRGTDLERYLRTKIERMGHMLSEPVQPENGNDR